MNIFAKRMFDLTVGDTLFLIGCMSLGAILSSAFIEWVEKRKRERRFKDEP